MGLFVLTETSAGYGLFKATDKKLLEAEDLIERLNNAGSVHQELKYKSFAKFDSAAAALEEITAIIDGKVPPKLAGLLNSLKDEKKVTLAVAETKLGNAINKLPGLNIKPVNDSATTDLFRAVRQHIAELVPGMEPEHFQETALGLAHSLSRHKVKFSPDKVDVMIVHAVSLLDDLDKELNTYAMRVKEWYGWHFPELAKILPDNLSYARVILALGMRSNAKDADLSEILPHEIEAAVKAAADISMGTEITSEDLENIKLLAEQVVAHSEYRQELAQYLENRMRAIAPNVTELVGPLVGARLIAHCKSLLNLAKNPGSTIQILGAEKALFRALKTKHNTPKYGLIYHASLVGQASGPNKGKIARQLAAKLALGVRTDALEEWDDDVEEDEKAKLGVLSRAKLEHNLRRLEGKPLTKGISTGANGIALPAKWDLKEARKYNIDADGLVGDDSVAPERKPLIEEVEDQEMDSDAEPEADSDDEDMEDAPATKNGAPRSPTLDSVSDDTEDEPEESENWQSEIQGATREAKKARKKERHERAAEQAPDKAAKRAARKAQEKRRIDREERRIAKREQEERRVARGEAPQASSAPNGKAAATPKKITEADYERLAKLAGLSVSKFTRRFEKGQIKVNEDGTLEVLSKKEPKAEEETPVKSKKNSKRKHEEEEEEAPVKEEKPKKKKKKHHKETED